MFWPYHANLSALKEAGDNFDNEGPCVQPTRQLGDTVDIISGPNKSLGEVIGENIAYPKASRNLIDLDQQVHLPKSTGMLEVGC